MSSGGTGTLHACSLSPFSVILFLSLTVFPHRLSLLPPSLSPSLSPSFLMGVCLVRMCIKNVGLS